MTITKEVFVDLQEKFNKVIKLIEDSKSDPDNEPYTSNYAARQLLLGMKANLEKLGRNKYDDPKESLKITAMLGAVHLYLGMLAITAEELTAGESSLDSCYETIKNYIDMPEVIMIALNMYNQLGILWSQREPEKSKIYLEKAKNLYSSFKLSSLTPLDISDLFHSTDDEIDNVAAWKNLEKVHTFTLYYLAQIYGALKATLKSCVYCHITLERQLEAKDYDPIDWALNAATLSQVFMEKNGFKQARHHLAASSYILDQYHQNLNEILERDDAYDAKMEVFKHRSADVARCWAKYGLLLLSKSKERLLEHTDDIDKNCSVSPDLCDVQFESNDTVTAEELQNLDFTSLDLTGYENQITYKFILTIQDARLVFLNIQNWLKKAESYYTLETLASDHIEIILDQSQMYLNLLFFDDNPENQAKLHKRRIDLLEGIINKINPQYYLQYCRQIWFDLGQTYYEILNIKSDRLKELNERPSPQMLAKINHLTERSIYNFICFIDSFKEISDGSFPKKISDDFEKAFLQACFHIGALNGKYVTLDKNKQLENVKASFRAYKMVVDYCKTNNKSEEHIPMEYNICKEMVSLLPVKIEKLRHEVS